MATRKNKKSKKRFRKTRSKRQRGGVSEAQRNDELLNLIDLNDPDVRLVIANLLEEGVSPVAKNTALHIASRKGYVELVSMLLAAGADVNAKDIYGNTALIVASQNGHTEIVAMLLAARADVNIKSDFGGTALMLASLRGHTEIVAKLLEKGADVNAENNYGQTALSLASLNGHTDIVKLLKQYLILPVVQKHLERQQNRLQLGRVMDSKKMPGDLTHKIITEHFGGKRKTRKSKRNTRLTGGYETTVINVDEEFINIIDSMGTDLTLDVNKLLYLMAQPAFNINIQAEYGYTALMAASKFGYTNFAKLLVKKADINIRDDIGTTALIFATEKKALL